VTQIAGVLSQLEDPFQMLPLLAVASELSLAVEKSETFVAERAGCCGVSPKYRDVEEEHHVEVVRLLIGSAFVLGQVAITQAIAITGRLRVIAGGPSWLPKRKAEVMSIEANTHAGTSLSEIVLIDAVANYFKHQAEWPAGWGGAEGPRARTIEIVRRLGLSPDSDENLLVALSSLGLRTADVGALGRTVQSWRERLAAHLRSELCLRSLT